MSAELQELPRWEVLDLVRGSRIGRLCVIDGGFPIAVPVNYRLTEQDGKEVIVVRTAANTMIARYEGLASLEIDHIDLAAGSAWSVIVRGNLRRVLGTHTLPDPAPIITVDRHQWTTLTVQAMSGRRFIIQPSADGFSVDWQMAAESRA